MGFFRKNKQKADPARVPETSDQGTNPYLNARQEWLERYGSYISRAAQWRAVAILALVIAVFSITGNVMQIQQRKIIPYVVEVDQTGRISATRRADIASQIPQRVIQSEIADVISNWRTVTADTELQKKMIQRLSVFMAGSAKGVLREWFEKNNPYEVAKSGKLVHVELKGLPLPVTPTTYRVEWTEIVRSHQGIELDKNDYEAIVTVAINTPTEEALILRNPGGIYITELSANKKIK